ncbi:alpha/beta-hydrolase [Jaminaea rosea]|uniref:Alpha/beta-hydrolase n=1 Tax=Jaminaea rosea TaxID=1569628 RepID=A0A316UWP5_9BASI|nr:alpha/beta-hydrolase [Jaminaea rosea]PWN28343.1 alpha/beta-hydrolase [Jaminaea rosea]
MSLSPCCLQIGSFHKGTPAGKMTKLDGKDTYVTGNSDSSSAILFIADVFGISLNNSKILADKYAEGTGATVYLPDYFDGKDLVAQGMLEGKSVDIPAFLAQFPPRDQAWKQSETFVAEIKKQQPSVKKMGAVGFCWGATSVLHLGSKDAGQNGVDAVAFAHPSIIEASDFEKLEKPGCFICPEHDEQFPSTKRQASWEVATKTLAPKKVFTSFVFLPGLKHGFATRGDSEDEFTATGMQHAANQVIGHFTMFLK